MTPIEINYNYCIINCLAVNSCLMGFFGSDYDMARLRILLDGGGCYHCISRIVDRNFRLGLVEKEFFVATMRRLESFLDVRVLTYCVMSNHFHLLIETPERDKGVKLTVDSLRRRLPLLYRGKALAAAIDELDRAEKHAIGATGSSLWIDQVVARYQARLGDVSIFVKELKWRFSMWYNEKNERVGTLWEDRFRSVLVEGDEHALMTIAAYIELNPVRAGLVSDPKDYRWCGYGEAVAGNNLARKRLAQMHRQIRSWRGDGRTPLTWREIGPAYRVYLFGQGERRLGDGRTGRGAKAGLDGAAVTEVIDALDGQLPLHEKLCSRVRYFSDGAVLGTADFVNRVFEERRDHFGPKRLSGARKMRGANWGDLTTLRDLNE